jgi:FtsP/CotA-like multicopper oxidase with cupredoxin domain
MRNQLTARISAALAALILVFVGWHWWQSLVPSTYSSMDMGYADFGGGEEFPHGDGETHLAHAAGGDGASDPAPVRDVSDLVARPRGKPDVRVALTARQETTTLADGTTYDGYTLNGSTPGPAIHAVLGDVVEVDFTNDNVDEGATLHWHGLDVPNAMDGVAGVTQDAVGPGQEFVYRFVADEVGTYWYHSHQVSHEQVRSGLLGALVVHSDQASLRRAEDAVRDVTAVVHTYAGSRTVNGQAGEWRPQVVAPVGSRVRVRVVNTDNQPLSVWVPERSYRLRATDGHEINAPEPVEDASVVLGAGARADVEVVVPEGGVRIQMGSASVVLGEGEPAEAEQPDDRLDLLTYGEATEEDAELRAAARDDAFDRDFDYDIGRRPGFIDGKPGMWWSINGHLFPDVPMFMVREGDLVRMRIGNHSGEEHPMHLHGHRITVLARDGEPVTGASWQVDSLNVEHGESYDIGFVADNPGVWMDHCHNLPHAKDGMIAHLMYEGVSTDFVVGGGSQNHPE